MSKFSEFISGAYKDISNFFLAIQETINYYPEIHKVEDKTRITLKSIPGTRLFCALEGFTGIIRALHLTAQDRFFVVKGSHLVEVFSDQTAIDRGTINTNIGGVGMADNGEATTGAGNQLILVDGLNGWIFDLILNTLTQITSPDFPVASQVIYQDTYFMVNEVGTNQMHISDSYDGLSWQGFQAGAEGSPDVVTNFINTNSNIFLFGEKSFEIWQDVGNPGFPYERIPQTFQSIGLLSVQSLASINNDIFFLGTNTQGFGQIMKSQGLDVVVISTQLLNAEIQSYSDPANSVGWCYQDKGHVFYVLNFKTDNKTWVYDTTSNMWHQRVSGLNGRWNYDFIRYTFNKNIVANFFDGKLYELTSDVYTENGQNIYRTRTSPHLFGEDNKWIFYKKFELGAKVGVGLSNINRPANERVQTGDNPLIILNYSKDGGNTWSVDLPLSLGKIGEYTTRLQWRNLGRARSMVFRVRCNEPVSVELLEAWVEASQGLN